MKMIMAIINNSDVKEVTTAMMEGGYYVTKIGSSGGFLRSGMTTLISVMQDDLVSAALNIIKKSTHGKKYNKNESIIESKTISTSLHEEIVVGGATVFVLNIEENYKF